MRAVHGPHIFFVFGEKKRNNQRWTVFLFEKNQRMFSQKMMRVSMERGLNFDKVEVFFANKPVRIRSGVRVDLEIT